MVRFWQQVRWGAMLWFALALLGVTAAWGQTLSYSVKFPRRGIRDRGQFLRLFNKQLRSQLVSNGFGVSRRRVRQGFHLQIRVSVEEELSADDPARCALSIDAKVIMMPQRRIVARDVSSSGSGKYRRASKMDRKKIQRLRLIATRQVARFFASNLRRLFRQIQAKLSSLKKGEVLGKKVVSKFRRSYGKRRGKKAVQGRPIPGRPPLLKLIPAGADHANSRPPFRQMK